MSSVTEREVFAALSSYTGQGAEVRIGNTHARVRLEAQDTHVGDSPDSLLWVTVELRVFEQDVSIRAPILVEAEKTGIRDAMEDLEKFVERGKHRLELPMLVVASAGFSTEERIRSLPVRFSVRQLPVGLLRGVS